MSPAPPERVPPLDGFDAVRDSNRFVRRDHADAARVFMPPSREALRLARWLGPLVAPRPSESARWARGLGALIVAPFTQLTFLSFDLQAFLFGVLHQTFLSRFGHFAFMACVNFFCMAGLAQLRTGALPVEHGLSIHFLNGSTIYAALLLAWYALIARSAGMRGWWFAMVPVVGALWLGSNILYGYAFTLDPTARGFFSPTPPALNPWLWMVVSAMLIALSHLREPMQPPRSLGARRWWTIRDAMGATAGAIPSPARIASALSLLALQFVLGVLNEWWASPRLLPYNVLMVLFRFGYRPDVYARHRAHVRQALASGNPALDFVGVGGGAYLDRDAA